MEASSIKGIVTIFNLLFTVFGLPFAPLFIIVLYLAEIVVELFFFSIEIICSAAVYFLTQVKSCRPLSLLTLLAKVFTASFISGLSAL